LLLASHPKKPRLAAKITTNWMIYFYIGSTTLFVSRQINGMAPIARLFLFLPVLEFDVNEDDHIELHLVKNKAQQTLNFTPLQFLG
jgi:hypothetical protein